MYWVLPLIHLFTLAGYVAFPDNILLQCFPQSVLAHRYRDASILSETLRNPLIPNFFWIGHEFNHKTAFFRKPMLFGQILGKSLLLYYDFILKHLPNKSLKACNYNVNIFITQV